jgi:hypothetical protein
MAGASDAVISVAGLTKRYGPAVAVDDVPFEVRRGEIFGLLGCNGAGKTTTVECLQGLRHAGGGRLRVLGLDPQPRPQELRRLVGGRGPVLVDVAAALAAMGSARLTCTPTGHRWKTCFCGSPATGWARSDVVGALTRSAGPLDYYVPGYVALVWAAVGLLAMPVHLVRYREDGVLRRLRASAAPPGALFGAQVSVAFLISLAGGILVVTAAALAYGIHAPRSAAAFAGAWLLCGVLFAALGLMLSCIPSSRGALGAGLGLFFVMMLLSGAGPPPEVLTGAMHWVGNALPLTYMLRLMQDPCALPVAEYSPRQGTGAARIGVAAPPAELSN